jgi:hypothetical protein
LNLSIDSIHDGATVRCLRVVKNFLMKFIEKEISLTGGGFVKESNRCMHQKYLKVPPGWILGTIKRELNLCEHDGTLDDVHDKALAYWR